MNEAELGGSKRPLWDRILALLEKDLTERRSSRFVVEVRCEYGLCEKEIGELSALELRGLKPGLREHVADLLLDRYLAEQSRVDLLKGKRAYTKAIRDLTPEDLPAVLAADFFMTEEQRKEREREEFAQNVQQDLDGLRVAEPAGVSVVREAW